jgi:hypothetical protein
VKLENIMKTQDKSHLIVLYVQGKGLIDGKGNLEINYNRICLNVGLALTLTTCMAL